MGIRRLLLRVVVAGLAFWIVSTPASAEIPPRTVTVTGTGRVSIKPNLVRSSIGLSVESPTVSGAMRRHRELMGAVLNQLREVGIADRDVLTTSFSFSFRPPWKKDGEWTKGEYHVSNMVRVLIRDLDSVDAVLEKVVEAGANQIRGLDFDVEDTEEAASQARALAANHARSKAEELAELHGVKLGPVISIDELGGGAPRPVEFERGVQLEALSTRTTSPGDRTVTSQLRVVYELR